MTIYVHNPPEPDATPTQPYYSLFDRNNGGWPPGQLLIVDPEVEANVAPVVFGYCGTCPSVPKIWKLTVPLELGAGTGIEFAGDYYLYKSDYTDRKPCTWTTRAPEAIRGANQHSGWTLRFSGVNGIHWEIISPTVTLPENASSRWEFAGDSFHEFRCLRRNTFVLSNPGGSGFPYKPRFISIEPFYG